MPAPGFCGAKGIFHRKLPPPGLVAHFFGGDELVKRDRLVLGPQTAGGTEVRNSAFGGNAGAGKGRGAARRVDEVLKPFGCRFAIGCDHPILPTYSVRRRRTISKGFL